MAVQPGARRRRGGGGGRRRRGAGGGAQGEWAADDKAGLWRPRPPRRSQDAVGRMNGADDNRYRGRWRAVGLIMPQPRGGPAVAAQPVMRAGEPELQ